MTGINALIKGTSESSPILSAMGRHSKKTALYEPGSRLSPDTESADALNLDLSSLQHCEK